MSISAPNNSLKPPVIPHPVSVKPEVENNNTQPQMNLPPIQVNVPVNVTADAKKEKSLPAGAFLYNDIYNGYRLFENLYLAVSSPLAPLAWTIGALIGTKIACVKIYKADAPEKIEQDSAVIDFGARIHNTGIIDGVYMIFKKFILGTLPMAHFDALPSTMPRSWFSETEMQNLNLTTSVIKHACIAVKGASFADEMIMRAAHWYSVQNKK